MGTDNEEANVMERCKEMKMGGSIYIACFFLFNLKIRLVH